MITVANKIKSLFEKKEKIIELDRESIEYFNNKNYIKNSENGVFSNDLVFGVVKHQNELKFNKNKLDHNLFVGTMGSGKSLSSVFTALTWFLENSYRTQMIIIDTMKGAMDYSFLFNKENVFPIFDPNHVEEIIDSLYKELLIRREKFSSLSIEEYELANDVSINRIYVVIESFLNLLNRIYHEKMHEFENNKLKEDTINFKLNEILKYGAKLGIVISGVSCKLTSSDITEEMKNLFKYNNIFKVIDNESMFLNNNEKASKLKTYDFGFCYHKDIKIGYPYFTIEQKEELLEKYYKENTSHSFYMNNFLIGEILKKKKRTVSKEFLKELFCKEKISDYAKCDLENMLYFLYNKQYYTYEVRELYKDSRYNKKYVTLLIYDGEEEEIILSIGNEINSKEDLKRLKELTLKNKVMKNIIVTDNEDREFKKMANSMNISLVNHKDLIDMIEGL